MKYLQLIRVKHWVKNILIFIPLICAGLIDIKNITITIAAFFSFCFMSSFIYVINDIKDIEKDKKHARKKNRPLPSGKISKKSAWFIAVLMLILSLAINIIVGKSILNISLLFLLLYMIINIFYSYGLKNFAIIDIALLASGFIIRVYYGASVIRVPVSNWLFLTILSASLFLGLGKRKKELIHNKEARAVLNEYNEEFLDKFHYLTLTLTLVFYSLWTIEQNVHYLAFTIPILIIIFMRYCLIVEKSDEGDPITILYQDKMLICLCGIYAILMLLFLW